MTQPLIKSSFLIFLFFVSAISCKQKEKINPVTANVYLRFDETNNTLHFESSFYKTTGKDRKYIRYDNLTLSNIPIKSKKMPDGKIRYFAEIKKNNFAKEHFLRFWNKGDDPFEITIRPKQIESFQFENQIMKSKGARLSVSGEQLEKNEKIYLVFTNEKNESARIDTPRFKFGESVLLSPKDLATLPIGTNTFYVVRMAIVPIEKDFANGSIILEYYSAEDEVEVIE